MASVVKKRTITRARETLTCNPCRSRKLKCDKDIPCSSCTKRGEAEACSYAKRPVRKEHADQSKTARAEERLQHLGDLLEIYASSGAVNNVTSHTEEDESSTCTNGSATYIGATHFSAMLDDIEWLRQVLVEEEPGAAVSPPPSERIVDQTDIFVRRDATATITSGLSQPLTTKDRGRQTSCCVFPS